MGRVQSQKIARFQNLTEGMVPFFAKKNKPIVRNINRFFFFSYMRVKLN